MKLIDMLELIYDNQVVRVKHANTSELIVQGFADDIYYREESDGYIVIGVCNGVDEIIIEVLKEYELGE